MNEWREEKLTVPIYYFIVQVKHADYGKYEPTNEMWWQDFDAYLVETHVYFHFVFMCMKIDTYTHTYRQKGRKTINQHTSPSLEKN